MLYGGAAGLHIQGTTKLGTVPTEDDVIEVVGALTQYYRETGFYLERIYKWAEGLGYDHIREVILDDPEQRKAYNARFAHAQSFAQVDPWAEFVGGKDAHEFNPINIRKLEAAE